MCSDFDYLSSPTLLQGKFKKVFLQNQSKSKSKSKKHE